MRVGLVNTFFPPYRGGAETYTLNVAENLAKMGHQVEIVCARSQNGETWDDAIKPHPRIQVHRLEASLWLYGTPILPHLFSKLMRLEVDLLHVNFPNPYNALVGAYISKIRGLPSVLTWHNDLPRVTRGAGILVRVHDCAVSPFYLNFYRRIVATTEIYYHSSRLISRFKDRVRVIHNGVDCRRFNPKNDGGPIRAKHGLEQRRIILFVGALKRWHRYKGVDILIRAFRHIAARAKDALLLIIGEGELRPYYEQLRVGLDLVDRVLFVGDVSDEELPQYYAAADLLVLPSIDRSEGFGLVLLEANASGKPVVASKVGGIPEVVRDGYNGLLVDHLDVDGLAEAVILLLEDDELREKMGRNGRTWAEEHDWSIATRALEKVYYEAVND